MFTGFFSFIFLYAIILLATLNHYKTRYKTFKVAHKVAHTGIQSGTQSGTQMKILIFERIIVMQKTKKSGELKELPKLPYGEGTLSYVKGRKDLIQYRKNIHGKRVVIYGSSVQECLKQMKIKENESDEKEKLRHPTETNEVALLQDAIYEWLFTFKKPYLKGRAFDTIEGTFNNQVKDTSIGRTSIQYVTTEDVQKHLNELIEIKSESTTKKTYNLFNQFFKYYYARDLNNNPMNLVTMPRKQIRYDDIDPSNIEDEEALVVLSDEEIERLTQELIKPYKPGLVGYSYGHMLLFIMWCFCRIGEVIALQLKDIDFEKGTAKIYKGYGREKIRDENDDSGKSYKWALTTPKSKKGRRVLYLSEKALYHLKKHIEINFPNASPDTFIFFTKQGNPMPDQYLNTILAKALTRSNITKHVTVHGLRHTGISYYLRHGVQVQIVSEQAGHSEVGITNDTYYDIIEEQKRDMYNGIQA